MRIFLVTPFKAEYRDIVAAIKEAIYTNHPKNLVVAPEDVNMSGLAGQEKYQEEISKADLIIADVSESNSFNLFEVGIATAKNKPVLFLAQKYSSLPFFISTNYLILSYDRSRLNETLVIPLTNQLAKIDFPNLEKNEFVFEKEKHKTVFISYNHEDKEYLKRLNIHLKPFEKSGKIDVWSDTKIKAGERFKEVIQKALEKAAVAILLVSADFLASDFIIDNELPPLLKYAEEKGTVILSVIVKPCLFSLNENLSQFQSINDPKLPLSKLTDNDKEEVYVIVAEEIYRLIK